MAKNCKPRDPSSRVEAMDVVILAGLILGYLSLITLAIYMLSGFYYICVPGSPLGDIAYTPKWFFLFFPLIFLRGSSRIEFLLEKFYSCIQES
ncbi:MAG TPA: hypothetical protein VKO42_03285 [Patescibacteria group bacterium]|nr:hypothetical protein [Patescibacteria group bacterium]